MRKTSACSAAVTTVACTGTRQDTQILHKNDTRDRTPGNFITTLRSWSCQDSNFPRRLFTLVPLKSAMQGLHKTQPFLNSVGGGRRRAWVSVLPVSLNSNQPHLFVCVCDRFLSGTALYHWSYRKGVQGGQQGLMNNWVVQNRPALPKSFKLPSHNTLQQITQKCPSGWMAAAAPVPACPALGLVLTSTTACTRYCCAATSAQPSTHTSEILTLNSPSQGRENFVETNFLWAGETFPVFHISQGWIPPPMDLKAQ